MLCSALNYLLILWRPSAESGIQQKLLWRPWLSQNKAEIALSMRHKWAPGSCLSWIPGAVSVSWLCNSLLETLSCLLVFETRSHYVPKLPKLDSHSDPPPSASQCWDQGQLHHAAYPPCSKRRKSKISLLFTMSTILILWWCLSVGCLRLKR